MKTHLWDIEKNEWLKTYRGISFDEIVSLIQMGCLLEIVEHHNKKKYPHQNVYIVDVDGYVYLVPYVETDGIIFLKTIIPSRKATKKYLMKGSH